MFLNIVGWCLKKHHVGRARWWKWKACGFLFCGYVESQDSMMCYRHGIFVRSTFFCYSSSLRPQSGNILKGKLHLQVVAVVCFGKICTVSRTEPCRSVITTFPRHQGISQLFKAWRSQVLRLSTSQHFACWGTFLPPSWDTFFQGFNSGPRVPAQPTWFPTHNLPPARTAYTFTSPTCLAYTSGFNILQPKHCPPCLGCARHHSNCIQLPLRHKGGKKKAYWPEHALGVLGTQISCYSFQKGKVHMLLLLQPLLCCLYKLTPSSAVLSHSLSSKKRLTWT